MRPGSGHPALPGDRQICATADRSTFHFAAASRWVEPCAASGSPARSSWLGCPSPTGGNRFGSSPVRGGISVPAPHKASTSTSIILCANPTVAAPGSAMRPDQAARQAVRKPGRGYCAARDADGGPRSGVGVRARIAAQDADVGPTEVEHLRHQRRADLEDQVRGSAAAAWQFPAQSLTSCVLRIRSGPRNPRGDDHLGILTLLNWPDASIGIAEPGPAPYTQVDSGANPAPLSLDCHFYSNERTKKSWS